MDTAPVPPEFTEAEERAERKRGMLRRLCLGLYCVELLCLAVDGVLYGSEGRFDVTRLMWWSWGANVLFGLCWLLVLVFGLVIWTGGDKGGRTILKVNGVFFLLFFLGKLMRFLEISL
ncbi:MAG: hypothetical protein D6820_02285 [Lentisphaerae bacterium]|nr:MAG: hypothetical protein D6820_02285 [Lentisphaerota bacterium]